MDVYRYLQQRTKFVLEYYDTAAPAFIERKCQIEAGEEPYKTPSWYDDDEPMFLQDWLDADLGLDVLGRSCVSIVSDSLKLYFQTWEKNLGLKWRSKTAEKKCFEDGYLNGYRKAFTEVFNFPWERCPADFAILEQATLARNRTHHPDEITSMDVDHDGPFLEKHPRPFFVEPDQKLTRDNMTDLFTIATIKVTRDHLVEVIRQTDLLCGWLEERLFDGYYGRYDRSKDVE